MMWVYLKVFKRKWSEPRWTGPHEVVERTSHAVRLRVKGETWYHWSQCAATEEPIRVWQRLKGALWSRHSDSVEPEKSQTSTQGAE